MKFVLDTHILLWTAKGFQTLPTKAQQLMSQEDHKFFFSVASLWEIMIKSGLGRNDFKVNAHVLRRGLLDNGYEELPILSEHVVAIESLPPIHKDPFDRLLIAQATVEGITLMTSDHVVAKYPGPIEKV